MIIYKTTNLLNGKIYVGKDCNNNPDYLGSGIWIKRAILKHGKDNFKKEVLELCDVSNINEREIYWIAFLNARNPVVGYNVSRGGDGLDVGRHLSEETKRKISEKARGRVLSEETRAKIGAVQLGKKKKPCAEATRRKISASLKGHSFTGGFSGKKHLDSTKEKISKAGLGRACFWAGKHLSEDHKKHIGDGGRGKRMSDTAKKKISLSKIGIPRSDETRRKISASRKKFLALAGDSFRKA